MQMWDEIIQQPMDTLSVWSNKISLWSPQWTVWLQSDPPGSGWMQNAKTLTTYHPPCEHCGHHMETMVYTLGQQLSTIRHTKFTSPTPMPYSDIHHNNFFPYLLTTYPLLHCKIIFLLMYLSVINIKTILVCTGFASQTPYCNIFPWILDHFSSAAATWHSIGFTRGKGNKMMTKTLIKHFCINACVLSLGFIVIPKPK